MKSLRASVTLLAIAAQRSVWVVQAIDATVPQEQRTVPQDQGSDATTVPQDQGAGVETAAIGFDDLGNVKVDVAKDVKDQLPDVKKDLDNDPFSSFDIDDDDDEYVRNYGGMVVDDDDDDDIFDDDDDFEEDNSGTDNEINCRNEHELCDFWASKGECDNNPKYMLQGCAKSCNSCSPPGPSRINDAKVMGSGYGEKYGEPQEMNHPDEIKAQILERLKKMEVYMDDVATNAEYVHVRNECKNREPRCLYWAFEGECKANPKYMQLHCAPACHSCDLLDYHKRCPMDPNAPNALQPGDLNKMFERIVAEEQNVTILSRPDYPEGEDETNTTYNLGPWVIILDDFISPEESEKLIELGGDEGYDRSTDVGAKKFDGTYDAKKSKTRTSTNAWCTDDDCYKNPLAQSATEKIQKMTGVPETNYEYLQLLRYEKGQFYRTHHDYIEHDVDRPYGPRILTAFLYLNDVEEGGGTNFPELKLTVMPKKGRILLWPSVLDEQPTLIDSRTKHQALDVEKGVKYAANAWIHLRNFKEAHEKGCT